MDEDAEIRFLLDGVVSQETVRRYYGASPRVRANPDLVAKFSDAVDSINLARLRLAQPWRIQNAQDSFYTNKQRIPLLMEKDTPEDEEEEEYYTSEDEGGDTVALDDVEVSDSHVQKRNWKDMPFYTEHPDDLTSTMIIPPDTDTIVNKPKKGLRSLPVGRDPGRVRKKIIEGSPKRVKAPMKKPKAKPKVAAKVDSGLDAIREKKAAAKEEAKSKGSYLSQPPQRIPKKE